MKCIDRGLRTGFQINHGVSQARAVFILIALENPPTGGFRVPPFKIADVAIRRLSRNRCMRTKRKHALTSLFTLDQLHQSVNTQHSHRTRRELS